MKILHRGSKLFIRHWLKWYVMEDDENVFLAIDEMQPLFEKPKEVK